MKKISEIVVAIVLFFAFGATMSFATTNIDATNHYAKVLLDGSYVDFGCPSRSTDTTSDDPTLDASSVGTAADAHARGDTIGDSSQSSASTTTADPTLSHTVSAIANSRDASELSSTNFSAPTCNVVVSDYAVNGSISGTGVLDINLDPNGGGVFNDGYGNLSGYAYGSTTGWVNFAPINGGVSIDGDGYFHGLAWGENVGWIALNCDVLGTCATDNFKVRTSWRPLSSSGHIATTPSSPSSSTGSSTSSPSPSPTPAVSISPAQPEPEIVIPVLPETTPATPVSPSNPSPVSPSVSTTPPAPQSNAGAAARAALVYALANLAAFLKTPIGENTFKSLAVLGAVATLLGSSTTSSWRSILSLASVRRRKPWGTVYDSITKQPLDPAYVVLMDKEGKEINTSITDLDGRYGFLAEPGAYTIVANKTNYIFPSAHLAGRTSDELYTDLYFGGDISVMTAGDVITKNIPLDPIHQDWNEQAKKQQNLMKFYSRRDLWIARITSVLFWFGFALSVFSAIVVPRTLNIAIVALYIIIFFAKETILKPKKQGMIEDTATGQPIAFAIMRIFSASLNTEVAHKATDAVGKYFALVPNGNYYVKIEKKNPDGSYTPAYTSEPFEVKKGVINRNFAI